MGFRRGFRPRRRLTWTTLADEIREEAQYVADWGEDFPGSEDIQERIATVLMSLADRLEGRS